MGFFRLPTPVCTVHRQQVLTPGTETVTEPFLQSQEVTFLILALGSSLWKSPTNLLLVQWVRVCMIRSVLPSWVGSHPCQLTHGGHQSCFLQPD